MNELTSFSGIEDTTQLANKRADERNHYLSFYQKYFKGEKVNGDDILYEEAQKMDEELKSLVESGKAQNYEEAIAELAHDKNFQNKSEYDVFMEEFARAAALKFAEDISANRFDEDEYYSSYNKILDKSENSPYKKQFDKEFSPTGALSMTGVEIINEVMPLLENYQREILKTKLDELTTAGDQEKINLLFSNRHFKELLEKK